MTTFDCWKPEDRDALPAGWKRLGSEEIEVFEKEWGDHDGCGYTWVFKLKVGDRWFQKTAEVSWTGNPEQRVIGAIRTQAKVKAMRELLIDIACYNRKPV